MKNPLITALIATGLLPLTSQGVVIGIENFDYTNGSVAGQAGGTGWNYERTDVAGAPAQTASNWNTTFGNPQVVSSALVTSGSGALREFGGITEGGGATNESEGAFRSDGTLFFAVSYTPTTANQWGGVSSYDFGTERIFWGAPGGGGGNFFGISAGAETLSTIPVVTGQTYTLIGMLDFDNDLLGLWVNPDGSDNVGTYDVSRVYTGTNWSSSLRLASGHESTWDNLRVGTTFADVAAIPEPSSALLAFVTAGMALAVRRRR